MSQIIFSASGKVNMSMLLVELFDSPVRWKVTANSEQSYRAEAHIKCKKIVFYGNQLDNDDEEWEVMFTLSDEKHFHTCAATGTGDQFAVFKFVMKAMADFIAEKEPKQIYFTSDLPSRTETYLALLKRYAKDYTVRTKADSEGVTSFYLKK